MCDSCRPRDCDYFVAPRTVACQPLLSMGFYRQENWSGLPFPSPGDLPDPRIKPMSPALAGKLFTTKAPSKVKSGNRVPVETPYINKCAFAAGAGCYYYSP